MFQDQIKKLDELTEKTAKRKKNFSTKSKKFSMKTNFKNYKIGSSRPKSDRGVTFHFKHSFVSKGRHVSKSVFSETPAGSHQSYIERKEAVEKEKDNLLGEEFEKNFPFNKKDNQESDTTPIFEKSKKYYDPGKMSFGTLGETKKERKDFWRLVESCEGRTARIQSRIIAELPYEASTETRLKIAQQYCKIFEENDLPYWCVIHAPSEKNDKRNYHMHIVYYDRPSKRSQFGEWDFSIFKRIKQKNRSYKETRPYKQNKSDLVRDKNWIKILRRHLADTANYHMALEGIEKRYDPRSYKESGIQKKPTGHMGTTLSLVESSGVDTKKGIRNTQKEIDYRLNFGELFFKEKENHIENIEKRYLTMKKSNPDIDDTNLKKMIELYQSLVSEGVVTYKKKELHKIAQEATSIRLSERKKFLEKSENSLLSKQGMTPENNWKIATLLFEERSLIEETEDSLKEFQRNCQTVITQSEKRLTYLLSQLEKLMNDILKEEAKILQDLARRQGKSQDDLSIYDIQSSLEIQYILEQEREKILQKYLNNPDKESENKTENLERTLQKDENNPKDHTSEKKQEEKNNKNNQENTSKTEEEEDTDTTLKNSIQEEQNQDTESNEDEDKDNQDDDSSLSEETMEKNSLSSNKKRKYKKQYPKTSFKKHRSFYRKTLLVFEKITRNQKQKVHLPLFQEKKKTNPIPKETKISLEEKAIQMLMGKINPKKENFVGALTLSPKPTPEQMRKFNKILDSFNNTEFYKRYIDTRNAMDLTKNQDSKILYKAAYEGIKKMASLRGIDLDTGYFHPQKAQNTYRTLHTDNTKEIPEKSHRIQQKEKQNQKERV